MDDSTKPKWYILVMLLSLLLNAFFLLCPSHINGHLQKGEGAHYSKGRVLISENEWGWSRMAADEAESVAAKYQCSGHGYVFVDTFLRDENGSFHCECNPCYSGPDCSQLLADCVVDVGQGDPVFLEPFWIANAEAGATVVPAWYRMSYNVNKGLEYAATSPELEKQIRAIHEVVGNAVTEGRYIVLGTGSTQLINAAVYSLSQAHTTDPSKVVATAPYYGSTKDRSYCEAGTKKTGKRNFGRERFKKTGKMGGCKKRYEPSNVDDIKRDGEAWEIFKKAGWDNYLESLTGVNKELSATFMESWDNFRVAIGDVKFKVSTRFIAKVTGLPYDGMKVKRVSNKPYSDFIDLFFKNKKEQDSCLVRKDTGFNRDKLPVPFDRVAKFVIQYITLEGRYIVVHKYHFPLLCHLRRKANVNLPHYLKSSLFNAIKRKGYLLHEGLIMLMYNHKDFRHPDRNPRTFPNDESSRASHSKKGATKHRFNPPKPKKKGKEKAQGRVTCSQTIKQRHSTGIGKQRVLDEEIGEATIGKDDSQKKRHSRKQKVLDEEIGEVTAGKDDPQKVMADKDEQTGEVGTDKEDPQKATMEKDEPHANTMDDQDSDIKSSSEDEDIDILCPGEGRVCSARLPGGKKRQITTTTCIGVKKRVTEQTHSLRRSVRFVGYWRAPIVEEGAANVKTELMEENEEVNMESQIPFKDNMEQNNVQNDNGKQDDGDKTTTANKSGWNVVGEEETANRNTNTGEEETVNRNTDTQDATNLKFFVEARHEEENEKTEFSDPKWK